MYIRTMERLNAADEYFFTPKYFQELEQIVRKNGWLVTGELDQANGRRLNILEG